MGFQVLSSRDAEGNYERNGWALDCRNKDLRNNDRSFPSETVRFLLSEETIASGSSDLPIAMYPKETPSAGNYLAAFGDPLLSFVAHNR